MRYLRFAPLAMPFVLASCTLDSPALGYGRAGFSPVEIGGYTFKVYTEETRNCVEVHRVNPVFPPPSRLDVMIHSAQAVKEVTGCTVEEGSFVGDHAMQKARLDCSDGNAAKNWVQGTCNIAPSSIYRDPGFLFGD